MLQKGFFLTDSYNRAPYWDGTVLVDLHGAEKFDDNTRFFPGRYRIELAPGLPYECVSGAHPNITRKTLIMSYDEVFTDYFMIRAYCGSSATGLYAPGTNPYSGPFKVNAVAGANVTSSTTGIDVNHIFGAGGGACYQQTRMTTPGGTQTTNVYLGGGGNCLGDGALVSHSSSVGDSHALGAGTCVHILPMGGIFGTHYVRAYHIAPMAGNVNGEFPGGSAYGGAAAGANMNTTQFVTSWWFTRGGDSPYGTGGVTASSNGTGVGAGKINDASGAYYNGSVWVDVPATTPAVTNSVVATNSFVKITYLGPLIPGQY